ncbi:transmembrane protein 254 [Synchiropus splendidus]|uniref:transmembrane protein 254 n=1 Tax=Synchiropus splendidus TaxID=270530 RepID=UPI00237E4AF5|nr:transmembrane protein 254 [Synchiropus splendidus]
MAQSNFFQLAGIYTWVAGILFDGFFTLLPFAPDLVPLSYLGPFGSFFQNLVDNSPAGLINFWWFLFGIHITEALLSFRVCTEKGVTDGTARFLWFFQTFLFGYFSLGLLFNYYPDRQKQK